MSDPIEKLEQTCEILGDKCKILIQDRKDNKIDEIGFVNQYFDMLKSHPDKTIRDNVAKDLSDFTKENFITKKSVQEE